MRHFPLALLVAAAGCSSSQDGGGGSRVSDKIVDAVISPLERKHIPVAEREDEGSREPEAKEPRKPKTVTFATLVVDTPVPDMPVFVDGQSVGSSRDAGNGRGRLRVRVTPGLHTVLCNGVERNVIARAEDGAKPVTIEAWNEEPVEETK